MHDICKRRDAFDLLILGDLNSKIGLVQIAADLDGLAMREEAEEGSNALDVGEQRGVEEGLVSGGVIEKLRANDEEMEAERDGRQKLASHFGEERIGDAEGLVDSKKHRERVEASQCAGVARSDDVEFPDVLAEFFLVFFLDVLRIAGVLAVHDHHH